MESEDNKHSFDPQHKYRLTHTILYLLSQYAWLLIVGLLYYYLSNKVEYSKPPEIKSFKQPIEWNSSYNPHIFGLISDLHITNYFPQRETDTRTILDLYNESGVEKVLIAGDICDNYETNTKIKYGHQYEDDFIRYKKIVDAYPSDLLIVASGNHDEFGIESYNSDNHYILKYCDFYHKNEIYSKYEKFIISKVTYDDIEFFILNPYRYPTVRAGIGYYMALNREILDLIEKVLFEKSNSTARFLLSHFPLSLQNFWVKSSSQKTLIEIVSSSNITSSLVGHSHIERTIHRNGSIEIHSIPLMDWKLKGRGFGYFSLDNGGFSYRSFSLKKEKPVAVLTYPIEKKYVSKMTDFSIENFEASEIRVVYFSEDSNLNITVSCSNGYSNKTDSLKFRRIIRSNQSLYSTRLKDVCLIRNENKLNEFHLTFSGDWKYSADFVVGDSVTLDKEVLENDTNQYKSVLIIGTFVWFLLLFVWFPFSGPPKFCEELNSLICSSDCHFYWYLFEVIFGPLVYKSRIYNNVSKKIQIVYFVLILSPLFLPYCFMKIGENGFGFIYLCGYYVGWFEFDLWASSLLGFFAVLILTPSTIVFSAISQISQTLNWSFVYLFDIFVALIQFLLIFVGIFKFLYQSTGFLFSITSPIFAFVPLIILILEGKSLHSYFVKRSTVYYKLDDSKNCLLKNDIVIEDI